MGFLDKAKENLEKVAKQGQDKLDEVQSKKKADGLLRDLGAWTYAAHTGRDGGKGPSEVERIMAELRAHEAEHGPLGADQPAGGQAASTEEAPTAPPEAQAHAVPPVMPPAPAGIVPPPPPPASDAPISTGAPPPPTYAPPLPPTERAAPEGGSTLDQF